MNLITGNTSAHPFLCIDRWNDFHVFSQDSQDEETDVFVAKEQRRFAHSAAEQKRRDAIRVSCYCVL